MSKFLTILIFRAVALNPNNEPPTPYRSSRVTGRTPGLAYPSGVGRPAE
jgi:hypothetical protein